MGDRPKPAISKFRADKIVSSSTSLDGFVVPASQSILMRDAVKLGKLEGNQLVGGPEDSDDDLKEIIELIKQGEAENVGPNLSNGSSSQTVDQDVSSLPPLKSKNKASRFKINRGGVPQPPEQTVEDPSSVVEPPTPVALNVTERRGSLRLEPPQRGRSPSPSPIPDTPLTTEERSSPKLPSEDLPIFTETLPSTPISRRPAEASQSTTPTPRELAPVLGIVREKTPTPSKTQPPVIIDPPSFKPPPSIIIDSPSFAPPRGHGVVLPSMVVDSPSFPLLQGAAIMPPMVIDSPNFPPPKGAASMPPMIIESPDFPPPKGVPPTPTNTSINAPAPLAIGSPSLPIGPNNAGPPRVMSTRVVERSPAGASQQLADAPGRKVSRFAAERW